MNKIAIPRPVGLEKPITAIGIFAEHLGVIGSLRVRLQTRKTHLKKAGRVDEDTNALLERTQSLEDFIRERLEDEWVPHHPAASWFTRISGCPLSLIGQVIGHIESFGKYYPKGDPFIPPYVRRKAVRDEGGERWVWVEGIERFTTPSKLRKYAGLVPGMKRVPGKPLEFNDQLRATLFRLGWFGFIVNKNRYYDLYSRYKKWKWNKLEKEGVKIRPTPSGRFCCACGEDKMVPATTHFCPECGTELSKKLEPEGIIWAGHFDMMGRREMLGVFIQHLWVVWREALRLPLRQPYPLEYTEHSTYVDPWDMCDLPPEE